MESRKQQQPTKSKRFLRLNPATNAFGVRQWSSLIATDRNGASATNGISVVVTPVNDRPKIVALAPLCLPQQHRPRNNSGSPMRKRPRSP